MEIDKAPLKEARELIEESIESVDYAYECDWDDDVHESYGVYIEETKALAAEFFQAMDNIISASGDVIIADGEALEKTVSSLESSLRSI